MPAPPRTAAELRAAFLGYFQARGHELVPSSSLIPHDPTMLLTTAGMVQFKPYMLGEEPPPYSRATSVQKCFRTTDIDIVGTTARHLTFFEMLGNFSLGDYFKDEAIPYAWEFVTETLGLDPDRLWVTVYEDDDEADQIWRDAVGVNPDRIQRLGDEDNFWAMGPTGPCGPCSEIFVDRGAEFGADGGPAHGGDDRFIEFWNLVFMQFNRTKAGALEDLPQRNIDTGSGLERTLAILQGTTSVFETDVLARSIDAAAAATGRVYGADERVDTSLKIIGEHGRAATFLVSDGVNPSNEERGYVLRRIIRRAVRHAVLLGADDAVMPTMVAATVDIMGEAYPELERNRDFVTEVIDREEHRFRRTLHRGLELLEAQLGDGDLAGDEAFKLHDSLGFPIDLTREIAAEHGRSVDVDRFEALMDEQRSRAKAAHAAAGESGPGSGLGGSPEVYRGLIDQAGTTEFLGYHDTLVEGARVLGLLVDGVPVTSATEGADVEVVLDRTPFYAEAGGQVGDTGVMETGGGARLAVVDTQWAVQGSLIAHRVRVESGEIAVDDEVKARVEATARRRTTRNHTGTHLLHWALREVLGDHVRQQGSHVAPDRLRFDFAHFEAVSPNALAEVEAAANEEVLSNAPVRMYETTKDHAESIGALAFFGDKYGDLVRVVEAGSHSVELCGGTHVHALGSIGPVKVLGESSIGANVRRIEALTGEAAFDHTRSEEQVLADLAASLNVPAAEVPARVERLQQRLRELHDEMDALRSQQALGEAKDLAAAAQDGVVVVRRDGLTPDDYRRLALATRDAMGSGVAVIAGRSADPAKAAIAAAVSRDLQERGGSAAEVVAGAARLLGGGTAKNPDVVVGGGKQPEAVDDALAAAREAAVELVRGAGS